MTVAFHIAVTTLLGVVLLTVTGNLLYLRWIRRRTRFVRDQGGSARARVSVLVPARNEAARIEACVAALERQTLPPIEILVLDDCSEDDTLSVLGRIAAVMPSLRVLEGRDLPQGWVGKPHACAQLASEAAGDWMLFVDADVTLASDGIAHALAIARATHADLLTVLPRQRMETLAERLAIPLLYFLVGGLLPMFAMPFLRWSRLAAASGQFMLFTREAYDVVGGHRSVRTALVEDVALAVRVRRARRNLVIANGFDIAECRMYVGARDVIEGFSKNAFAGAGESVVRLLAISGIAVAMFVAPPLGLIARLAGGGEWKAFALELALAVAARAMLALEFRQPVWTALLHPIAVLLAVFIGLRSYVLTRFRGGVRWRGRRYGPGA